MKILRLLNIQGNMTHLNPTRTLTQAACLLLAIGCSSRVEVAGEETGGQPNSGGGSSTVGGTGPGATYPLGTSSGGTTEPLRTGPVSTGVGGTTEPFGTDPFGTRATGGTSWEATGGASWEATGGASWPPSTGVGGTTEPLGTGPVSTGVGGTTWTGSTGTGGLSSTVSTKAYTTGTGGSTWTGSTGTGGSTWTSSTKSANGGKSSATGVCTPGADETCNDDPTVSAVAGHCQADTSCTCGDGYVMKWQSGKCTTYEQTVCYSPTQNIDMAYVQRAFGCHCTVSLSPPYCGIDSAGLRVYLFCSNGTWQSDSTGNCNGSDPLSCYSPTQNVNNAFAPNAIGCSCNVPAASPDCVAVWLNDAGTDTTADAGVGSLFTMGCVNGRWKAFPAGCS